MWVISTVYPLLSQVVAPFPSILTAPSGLNARNGSEVVLSCQVSGFSNATRVVWERNGKVVNTSFGGKYSTRRKTVGEEFMEHLTFMVKPTLAGNYSCCVGWSEGSGLSGEVVCSASNGTVTVYFAGKPSQRGTFPGILPNHGLSSLVFILSVF